MVGCRALSAILHHIQITRLPRSRNALARLECVATDSLFTGYAKLIALICSSIDGEIGRGGGIATACIRSACGLRYAYRLRGKGGHCC